MDGTRHSGTGGRRRRLFGRSSGANFRNLHRSRKATCGAAGDARGNAARNLLVWITEDDSAWPGSGRIHEGMDDAQLSDFLRKLALRADGPPIAIEILGMRVFGAKSDKLSVSEAIKDMGRELIAQVSFTNRESHHHEFMLARLIE